MTNEQLNNISSDFNENQTSEIQNIENSKDYNIATTLEDYITLSKHFYAGFWLRVVAYTLDLIAVFSITGLFNTITRNKLNTFELPLISQGISFAIVYFLYFIFMTYFLGQTLGKMVVGIKVETNKGEKLKFFDVVFREVVGRLINMGFFNIPYLSIVFLEKKKGVHDLIAETVVVKEDFSNLRKKMNDKISENRK